MNLQDIPIDVLFPLGFIALLVALLWIALPFAVFSIHDRIKKIHKLLEQEIKKREDK